MVRRREMLTTADQKGRWCSRTARTSGEARRRKWISRQVPSQKSHQRQRGVNAAELHWSSALDCVPAMARIVSRDSGPLNQSKSQRLSKASCSSDKRPSGALRALGQDGEGGWTATKQILTSLQSGPFCDWPQLPTLMQIYHTPSPMR